MAAARISVRHWHFYNLCHDIFTLLCMSWASCWEVEQMLADSQPGGTASKTETSVRDGFLNICKYKITPHKHRNKRLPRTFLQNHREVKIGHFFMLQHHVCFGWTITQKHRVLVVTLTNGRHKHWNVILHRTARWNKVNKNKTPASFTALFLTSPSSRRILFVFIFPTSSN